MDSHPGRRPEDEVPGDTPPPPTEDNHLTPNHVHRPQPAPEHPHLPGASQHQPAQQAPGDSQHQLAQEDPANPLDQPGQQAPGDSQAQLAQEDPASRVGQHGPGDSQAQLVGQDPPSALGQLGQQDRGDSLHQLAQQDPGRSQHQFAQQDPGRSQHQFVQEGPASRVGQHGPGDSQGQLVGQDAASPLGQPGQQDPGDSQGQFVQEDPASRVGQDGPGDSQDQLVQEHGLGRARHYSGEPEPGHPESPTGQEQGIEHPQEQEGGQSPRHPGQPQLPGQQQDPGDSQGAYPGSQQAGSYGVPPGTPPQPPPQLGSYPEPGPYGQQPPYAQQPGPYADSGNPLAYPGPPHAQQYPGPPQAPQQHPGPPHAQQQHPGPPHAPQYPGPPHASQYPPPPHAQQYPGMPHAQQQYPGPPHAQHYPGMPHGQQPYVGAPYGPQQYPGGGQYPGMYPGQPMPQWVRPSGPRVLPVPPDTPYHRLARNAKHTWWRPIVGTLVLAAGAVVLTIAVVIPWMIVHTILAGDLFDTTPTTDELFANVNEEIAVALISIGILTPAVLFTVRFIQRRPAWSIASVVGRIRWRWLLLCCLPALAYLAISYLLGIVVELVFPSADTPADEGSWVGFGEFIVPALIIIGLVPFQSAAEEFVFRGWVIQAIGSYGADRVEGKAQWLKRALRTPWPGIVVTSILFVAAHGYTDWAMADIFLFAMLVGWLTVYTGGLEAAIALHVLNNLAAFGVSAATGQLEGWDVQGSAPWTTLLMDIPAFGAFGVLVVWLARRRQIARVSPAAAKG